MGRKERVVLQHTAATSPERFSIEIRLGIAIFKFWEWNPDSAFVKKISSNVFSVLSLHSVF